MPIKFEFLPHAGESILVTTDEFTMLIDGGCINPFRNPSYNGVVPNIDIVVVTHVDNDHIEGIIQLFEDSKVTKNIKHVLFNEPKNSALFSTQTNSINNSYGQGNRLEKILRNTPEAHINDICTNDKDIINLSNKTILNVLSPSKESLLELHEKWYFRKDKIQNSAVAIKQYSEHQSVDELANHKWEQDKSLPNKSSLAFLLNHETYKFLLLGDAHIDQITNALNKTGYTKDNPLHVDFVKLSHHGSKKNINLEFLEIIRTNTYIICKPYEGNGKLPNRETIAKIAKYGQETDKNRKKIIYVTKSINKNIYFSQVDKEKYNFDVINITDPLKYGEFHVI